jgi:hypothetical protein
MCHAMIDLGAQRRETEERLRHLARAVPQDDTRPAASPGWRGVIGGVWAALTSAWRAA